MAVKTKPIESAPTATSQPDSLVVYSHKPQTLPSEITPVQRKGLFRHKKGKQGPTGDHVRSFLFENIESLPEHESRMLCGIFSLSTLTAREVMIPLSELMAVHTETPTEQVKAMVRHSSYRYIPVYEERIDRLTGVANIIDILYAPNESDELNSFVEPGYYVPETKLAIDLLEELRSVEDPVAIVIDEHAGCVGFVTLEDIIEQIIGEMCYNHKRNTLKIEPLGNGSWVLDARTSIDIVNGTLNLNLPKDGCDTIGGFILKLLGRLPERGEKIVCEIIQFTIEEVFAYGITVLHATQIQPQVPLKKRQR